MDSVPPEAKWAWLINAASSPAFWKAAVAFATSMGLVLSPDQVAAITSGGLALMSLINAFQHVNRNKP